MCVRVFTFYSLNERWVGAFAKAAGVEIRIYSIYMAAGQMSRNLSASMMMTAQKKGREENNNSKSTRKRGLYFIEIKLANTLALILAVEMLIVHESYWTSAIDSCGIVVLCTCSALQLELGDVVYIFGVNTRASLTVPENTHIHNTTQHAIPPTKTNN